MWNEGKNTNVKEVKKGEERKRKRKENKMEEMQICL